MLQFVCKVYSALSGVKFSLGFSWILLHLWHEVECFKTLHKNLNRYLWWYLEMNQSHDMLPMITSSDKVSKFHINSRFLTGMQLISPDTNKKYIVTSKINIHQMIIIYSLTSFFYVYFMFYCRDLQHNKINEIHPEAFVVLKSIEDL